MQKVETVSPSRMVQWLVSFHCQQDGRVIHWTCVVSATFKLQAMLLKIQSSYLLPLLCKVVCQIAKICISYLNPVVLSSYFYVFNCTNFCGLVSCTYFFWNILKFLHILLLRLFLKFLFEMQKLFYLSSNLVQFKAEILLRWSIKYCNT